MLAIRALRKLLGSLNPVVRCGQQDCDEGRASFIRVSLCFHAQLSCRCAIFAGALRPAWPGECQSADAAETLGECLRVYFGGGKLPCNFWRLWNESSLAERCHPASALPLPRPLVAVLLEDAGRTLDKLDRAQAIASAYQKAFADDAHPRPDSIKEDLQSLAKFFSVPVATAEVQASPDWHLMQLRYLRQARIRPMCPRAGSGKVKKRELHKLQPVPACGPPFQECAQRQSTGLILRGLTAAYRSKLWCVLHKCNISLGTVGVERLWRNYQRRARNKGRSGASEDTVDLLLTWRWLQEVSGRVAARLNRENEQLGIHQLLRAQEVRNIAEFLGSITCPLLEQQPPLAAARLRAPNCERSHLWEHD